MILGSAPVNKVDPLIEGGIIGGTSGGSDPNDDSGVFKYVRIEYCGYRFQLDDEVNGLTMGGVGAGTEIHHVQVSYSFDDSYEWFGGTVNCDHLVCFGGTDDEFDTDFGYTGNVQFAFGMKNMNNSGSHGRDQRLRVGQRRQLDLPGDAVRPPPLLERHPGRPRAHRRPGRQPARGPQVPVRGRAAPLDPHQHLQLGHHGLPLGHVGPRRLHPGPRPDRRPAAARRRPPASVLEPGSATVHDEGRWAGIVTWYNSAAYANTGSAPRNPSAIGLTDLSDMNNPNPVPAAGSELIGSADFSAPALAGFTVTTYRGAFDPALPMDQQWTAGWTNFNPQGTAYVTAVGDGPAAAPRAVLASYPNPFNPSTAVKFSVPRGGHVSLKVFDMRGREVAVLVDGRNVEAGEHTAVFAPAGASCPRARTSCA